MNEEEIVHYIPTHYMCGEWKSNYERSERGEEEMEQSRCQSHTSHVAVVDLPPPSLHPLVLTSLSGCQQCFSAWRQSFTKVCFLLPSTFTPSLADNDNLWLVASVHPSQAQPRHPLSESTGIKVEPIVFSRKIPMTQHLCLQKRSVSKDREVFIF